MMMPTVGPTNVDPVAKGWAIEDPVVRFRVLGSERVFDLSASDHWVLGSSPECSLHLDDPSGRISRRHAVASHEGGTWVMQDLGSTNGLRINRQAQPAFHFAAGDEIALGGITLLAESHRSMELHDLLRRWLGWSESRLGEVDRALGAVRDMANMSAALLLRGVQPLAELVRRLHRATLGDRPFIALRPNERSAEVIDRADNGMLCVDARRPPGDIHAVLAKLCMPDTRARVVACVEAGEPAAELAAMLTRVVTVSIPSLMERTDEIERLLEAYGSEAAEELGASRSGLRPSDPKLVYVCGVSTLDELADFVRRLVAFRNWGVTNGAHRLEITSGTLSRWVRRRKIPA